MNDENKSIYLNWNCMKYILKIFWNSTEKDEVMEANNDFGYNYDDTIQLNAFPNISFIYFCLSDQLQLC